MKKRVWDLMRNFLHRLTKRKDKPVQYINYDGEERRESER